MERINPEEILKFYQKNEFGIRPTTGTLYTEIGGEDRFACALGAFGCARLNVPSSDELSFDRIEGEVLRSVENPYRHGLAEAFDYFDEGKDPETFVEARHKKAKDNFYYPSNTNGDVLYRQGMEDGVRVRILLAENGISVEEIL